MHGLLPPQDDYWSGKVVFEVQTADVGPVYMSVQRTPLLDPIGLRSTTSLDFNDQTKPRALSNAF